MKAKRAHINSAFGAKAPRSSSPSLLRPLTSFIMSRPTWISAHHKGHIKLFRMKIEYGLSVGHLLEFPFGQVLEEIEIAWHASPDPDVVHFRTTSYQDLDADTGEVIGPSSNIAGLFSFEARISTQKILHVYPGALDMNFVLSTLQENLSQETSVPKESLMTIMVQDSVVAAEEIAHEIWNELVVSCLKIDSSSASTPRPVSLHGATRLSHKITTETDCAVSFHSALHLYASKLSRYVSHIRGHAYSPPGAIKTTKGGEENDHHRPFRTSRGNRTFNASRAEWAPGLDQEILDTVQAMSYSETPLRVDSAKEYQTYFVTNDSKRRPLCVETHRNRRCMFRFGPHVYLVTGARFGMIWVASWKGSPFSDKAILMKEVRAFASKAQADKNELSSQYIHENTDLPARDVRLVEAAFRTCLQPLRDSLAPVDIELAMKRLGHSVDSEIGGLWFDNLRKYDADGTGFMELNEFYLFCHDLSDDEVRELTFACAPVLVLPKDDNSAHADESAMPATLQLDALNSKVSFYFNEADQKLKTLERELVKRPCQGILDLDGLTEVKRYRARGKWNIQLYTAAGDEITMIVAEQDVDLVDRVGRWIVGLTQFHEEQTDLRASPQVFMSLAHTAVHAVLS